MDEIPLNKRIEFETAKNFLAIYNQRYGRDFQVVVELCESPDVRCVEPSSQDTLFIELTLLEDWQRDIRHELGRGDRRDVSPETGQAFVTFHRDTLNQLACRLEDKLQASYSSKTALVVRQISILWSANDWRRHAYQVRKDIIRGREGHYPAGIWILCTDGSTWPAQADIFGLTESTLDSLQEYAISEVHVVRVEAMVAWEGYETPDFQEFASRDDVHTTIRLESAHGCGRAVLIACAHDMPLDFREEAIQRYRADMERLCICGHHSQDIWSCLAS